MSKTTFWTACILIALGLMGMAVETAKGMIVAGLLLIAGIMIFVVDYNKKEG